MNIFDRINFFISNTEASFVNLLSSIAPWLAPLAPAYMSFDHMDKTLGFPFPIALAIGITIEVIGLSTVSTAMAFHAHNKRHTAKYKRAPVGMVVFLFVFYLITVFMINIVLDLAPEGNKYVEAGASGSLILLEVPAALLIAIRTQHTELLNNLREEKEKKERLKVTQKFQRSYIDYPQDLPINVKDFRKLSKILTPEHREWILRTDANIVAELFGVSRKTAYNWKNQL